MNTEPLNDLREFPRLIRWLFPEIELLRNNGVYGAFEARRRQLRSRMPGPIRITVNLLITVALAYVLYRTAGAIWFSFGSRGLIILLGFSAILYYSGNQIPSIRRGVPASILSVFSGNKTYAQYYLDLHLAPIPSDELILAAACVEYRRSKYYREYIVAVVIGSLILWGIFSSHPFFLKCLFAALVPIEVIGLPVVVRRKSFNAALAVLNHLHGQYEHPRLIPQIEKAHAERVRSEIRELRMLPLGCLAALVLIGMIFAAFGGVAWCFVWAVERSVPILILVPDWFWQIVVAGLALLLEFLILRKLWRVFSGGVDYCLELVDIYTPHVDRARALCASALSGDDVMTEHFQKLICVAKNSRWDPDIDWDEEHNCEIPRQRRDGEEEFDEI
ncbi:hypothetical protein KQI84_08280 [bacterium]|nr:hypothetical protein [bacterium]